MRRLVPLLLVPLAISCPEPEPEPEPPLPGRWEQAAPWTLTDPFPCPVAVDPDDDLLGELLAELDLDRSIGIPRSWYEARGGAFAADPTRLDFFHDLQEDFGKVPCHAGNLAARTDTATDSDHALAALIADAAVQLDVAVTAGGPWPVLEGDQLLAAVDSLHGGSDWDGRDAAAALPEALKEAVARVLLGADEAADLRDDALEVMGDATYFATYFRDGGNSLLVSEGSTINPDWEGASDMFVGTDEGSGALYSGAVRLAQAIDEADWAAAAGQGGEFDVRIDTPLGLVVLRGTGNDLYDPSADPDLAGEVLLVVDVGGNDEIRTPAGANTSEDHPVAVHIDLGGDDLYAYPEVPHDLDGEGLLPSDAAGRHAPDAYYGPYSRSHLGRQGAGRLGYGFLVDLGGGDDTYRSLRKSQGFAAFGVGVLADDVGDDTYTAENGA